MKNKEKGAQVLRGFCMGCADVIPGVSGGTMALILGIYETLIDSIRLMDMRLIALLFRKDFWVALLKGLYTNADTGDEALDRRVKAAHFLAFLVFGILLAVVAAARAIKWSMHTHPVPTSAFFFGLVLISIRVPFKHMRRIDAWPLSTAAVFSVLTYIIVGLELVQPTADPAYWYLFICGAIAISAMILPGISGAFFLLLLGVYQPVLTAVDRLVHEQHLGSAIPLLVLICGIVVGVVVFSRVLHWFLSNHHDATMGALVGLMLGSLRVLWPFKEALEPNAHRALSNRLPVVDGGLDPNLWPALGTFAVGIAIVLILERLGDRQQAAKS